MVITESSSYQLDLDTRVGVRIPGRGDGKRPAVLRKDGENWELLEVISCEVGTPMRLLVKGLADAGIPTIRTTTPVKTITKVS